MKNVCYRFSAWFGYGGLRRDEEYDATELGHFVMFSKMLRKANQGQVKSILHFTLRSSNTVLRYVAEAKPESLRLILNALPQFASMKDRYGNTVLDYTAKYGRPESLRFILSYPESQRFHVACGEGNTVLYSAARSTDLESVTVLLDSIPESQRLQAVSTRDPQGRTVLHHAARSHKSFETMKILLALYPGRERVEAVRRQDRGFCDSKR